ncbi:MAG: hypothetical protein NC548_30320 [Lachnospiraceae bacterium]|nr:hypothetical protein [Lachnospiraceae bacterium]
MTRTEFESMGFDAVMSELEAKRDDIMTHDTLKDFAKDHIDHDNFNVAIHILETLEGTAATWYEYDYCMGTLRTPSPITCKDDVAHLID